LLFSFGLVETGKVQQDNGRLSIVKLKCGGLMFQALSVKKFESQGVQASMAMKVSKMLLRIDMKLLW